MGDADEIDRLIERSSLGSAEARALRARTDASRTADVLQLAELQARMEEAADATEMAAAAKKLAAHLRDLGRPEAAKQVLADAIDSLDVSNIDHRRLIAELHWAAGEPDQASVWFEHAADAGDPRAFDDELAVLWTRELPPAGARSRAALQELPSPGRELVAATTFIGMDLQRAAKSMRLSVEAAQEHEIAGLQALNDRLHDDDWWPGGPTIHPPNNTGLRADKLIIGGTVHFAGFDADFADSTTMPGEVIGSTLTDDERARVQRMDPKDRARYLLQKRIQEKAEMTVLLSQLQSLRHQTALSVVNNIR